MTRGTIVATTPPQNIGGCTTSCQIHKFTQFNFTCLVWIRLAVSAGSDAVVLSFTPKDLKRKAPAKQILACVNEAVDLYNTKVKKTKSFVITGFTKPIFVSVSDPGRDSGPAREP